MGASRLTGACELGGAVRSAVAPDAARQLIVRSMLQTCMEFRTQFYDFITVLYWCVSVYISDISMYLISMYLRRVRYCYRGINSVCKLLINYNHIVLTGVFFK